MVERTYDIIYADPPWRYRHCASNSRRIENQYPTMTLDEIKNLTIPANENALLYLWATAPKLQEALEVMGAWGFDYRTCLVWDKEIIGMGYWFRSQHEILLVGVKGKFSPPLPEKRISSIYRERRGKHSAKPRYIRNIIDSFFPDCEKIELFARERVDGWAAWGNEVPKYNQRSLSNED